jgi:hypothetical protein
MYIRLVHILIFNVFLTFNSFHPLHLSVLNIDFSPESGHFTLALKVFTNDLEDAVLKQSGERIGSGNPDEAGNYAILVSGYILTKLALKFDNPEDKPVKINYVGKKSVEDSTWLYFQVAKPEGAKRISLTNTVMSELFPDQTNLVIFKYNEKNDGTELNKSKTSVTFDLD